MPTIHLNQTTTDSNVWGGASGHTYTFTGGRTAPPPSTPSWSATATTSRDTCSAFCSASPLIL